jgi:Zinc carboxypeptidase
MCTFRTMVAVGLAAAGVLALVAAAADLVHWISPAQYHGPMAVGTQSTLPGSSSRPELPRRISSLDISVLANDLQSQDKKVQHLALAQIKAMAKIDRRSLVAGLPDWLPPLLASKRYKEVEQLTHRAILARPYDSATIRIAQRARVLAFLGDTDYSKALSEAKGYYNIASLAQADDAVDLLQEVLAKTDGPAAASRFRSEQSPVGSHLNDLDAIYIDPTLYGPTITKLADPENSLTKHPHELWMARGNLLLLSGRPLEAKQAFEAACNLETRIGPSLREALEGLADAERARTGSKSAGDQFISAVQQGGTRIPEVHFASLNNETIMTMARQIAPAGASGLLPAIELIRAQQESQEKSASQIKVISDFEGSTPVYVTYLSPTHLVLEITTSGYRDWFMFRLLGVANKIVRVDITGAYKTVPGWAAKSWSLNPVYSYDADLSEPTILGGIADNSRVVANNGTFLPDTSHQNWHYLSDVWSDNYTLSFVQRFQADSVCIAMRPPRTPSCNERYFRELGDNPRLKVVEIGQSKQHHPLLLAQIGSAGADKPCVLLYAGEHADEEDVGWAAQGAIDFLLGNAPTAIRLRQKCTFLVIPMLDPDASAAGLHQGIISSFYPGRTTQESVAYANWFAKWIGSGHRLDLVVDLHNVQSSEEPHVSCPLLEGDGARGAVCFALHELILNNLQQAGFDVRQRPTMRGWMPDRLGGWLSRSYGTLSMAYEVNSQAPERHLTLAETKNLGAIFTEAIGSFFEGRNGNTAMAAVDAFREQRSTRLAGRSQPSSQANAIVTESSSLTFAMNKGNPELIGSSIP